MDQNAIMLRDICAAQVIMLILFNQFFVYQLMRKLVIKIKGKYAILQIMDLAICKDMGNALQLIMEKIV